MPTRDLFSSDRQFVVWSYQAGGHNGLVLRSRKDNVHDTRLTVFFGAVYAMEVRCCFDALTVEEVDKAFATSCRTRVHPDLLRAAKVYRLFGKNWEGYVVSLGVSIAEDDKEMNEPVDFLISPDEYRFPPDIPNR